MDALAQGEATTRLVKQRAKALATERRQEEERQAEERRQEAAQRAREAELYRPKPKPPPSRPQPVREAQRPVWIGGNDNAHAQRAHSDGLFQVARSVWRETRGY